MRTLCLRGNGITRQPNYRARIICTLPQLRVMDFKKRGGDQRRWERGGGMGWRRRRRQHGLAAEWRCSGAGAGSGGGSSSMAKLMAKLMA